MRCLYFTYDGLMDPLGQSQIIPYIERLAACGHTFTIISFEKEDHAAEEISILEHRLNGYRAHWVRLPFKWGKLEMAKRIIRGIIALRRVSKRVSPDLVHLRGLMSAVIFKLSLVRIPHLYDIRAFIGEWADIGKIKPGTFSHYVLSRIDRNLVATAAGLVVLEKSGELLLHDTYKVPKVPIKVIRTSTDVSRYRPWVARNANSSQDSIRFVYLGGIKLPYRPDLALKLVLQLLSIGVACKIDFISERDHADIYAICETLKFPHDKITIRRLEQRIIPWVLAEYDCGLIFNNSSPWRRASSPTKLGEYLAAGLPVISLEGIAVVERFASITPCVRVVPTEELVDGFKPGTLEHLVSFIRQPGIGCVCQELASREFSMEMAGKLYAELYSEIQAGL